MRNLLFLLFVLFFNSCSSLNSMIDNADKSFENMNDNIKKKINN